MKVYILFLLSFLTMHSAVATEVYGLNINQGKVNLKIHEVELVDFDEILLTNKNGRKMSLVCSSNTYYGAKISLLRYKNFYNIPVADFVLSDDSCFYIHKFLTDTFEAINEEFPVKIKLDIESKRVEAIHLPPLDPYWDGGDEKVDPSEENININNLKPLALH